LQLIYRRYEKMSNHKTKIALPAIVVVCLLGALLTDGTAQITLAVAAAAVSAVSLIVAIREYRAKS
jgi:hypothetical protein